MLCRGLYLLDLAVKSMLWSSVTAIWCLHSVMFSARVTSRCIIIYFDDPTFPHPAVLTCCVQLWVSCVGAGSNNDDDSGATVFPVNNKVLSLAQNVHYWLHCNLVYWGYCRRRILWYLWLLEQLALSLHDCVCKQVFATIRQDTKMFTIAGIHFSVVNCTCGKGYCLHCP